MTAANQIRSGRSGKPPAGAVLNIEKVAFGAGRLWTNPVSAIIICLWVEMW